MVIPPNLSAAIQREVSKANITDVANAVKTISQRYREEVANGKKLVTQEDEVTAYIATRMCATYGAIFEVFSQITKSEVAKIETMIDAGAGTGAGVWAAREVFGLGQVISLEREPAMIKMGRKLLCDQGLATSDDTLSSNDSKTKVGLELDDGKNNEWWEVDLVSEVKLPQADLVLCSYILNEMDDSVRDNVVKKLWASTKKLLVIIEPGTPKASQRLLQTRAKLIGMGAKILLPCPHEGACEYTGNDWCHFAARIPRSKIHMQLKQAQVPYEDEKFSYMVFSKEKEEIENTRRVLRHPYITKGMVELEVCTNCGILKLKIKKRDGEIFKVARKVDAGDNI